MTFEDELGERYEVVRTVGSGGQGTVLQARDRQHDRPVALKIYTIDPATPRDELLLEADVLLRLSPHAALPTVRDDFFLQDRYVIVMDWIDGKNLYRKVLDEGDPGLPLRRVLDCVEQVAEALDHLHGHDPPVFHGDVKPSNIIMRPNGRVVLVDFGISIDGMPRRGQGTPGFRAPEVAAGGPLTAEADVFGLAATAFTLLTGHPPRGDEPSWEGLDPVGVAGVARTLRRALSILPAARPASAGELAERLNSGALPAGDVTFLLTELSDAELLWETHGAAMRPICNRLDDLICEVVESRGGRVVGKMNEGEGTFVVFTEAAAAATAALGLHERIGSETWPSDVPVAVRSALYSGRAELRDGRYVGPSVSRAARLRALAAPGTTIASQATAQLAESTLPPGAAFVDLGERTIEGSNRPEHIYRLDPASSSSGGLAPVGPVVPAAPAGPVVPVPIAAPDPVGISASPTPGAPARSPEPISSRSWSTPSDSPRRLLPEHWRSRRTADAIMAPSAILLGGGAAAIAIVAGAAVPVVVVAGAGVWAVKVATAFPRRRGERITPSSLAEPWRSFVLDALDAQSRYQRACRRATSGPLRDRLVEIEQRVDAGVHECWRVAQRGDALGSAILDLEVEKSRDELTRAESALPAAPTPTQRNTVDALRAKVESGDRLTTVADDAVAQLRLVNARLDEAVARAVELSNQADAAGDVAGLGGDIDGLVGELESLRGALDEATGHEGPAPDH